jgi:hypothetical protein
MPAEDRKTLNRQRIVETTHLVPAKLSAHAAVPAGNPIHSSRRFSRANATDAHNPINRPRHSPMRAPVGLRVDSALSAQARARRLRASHERFARRGKPARPELLVSR